MKIPEHKKSEFQRQVEALAAAGIVPEPVTRVAPCAHGERKGCCKVTCLHPQGDGLVVSRRQCRPDGCRYYEGVLQKGAA